MASAGPTATSSSTSSSSSAVTSGTGMPVILNGNSSLPFSFLITFIAIFLFFLGCGLGSRRVSRQLRRNLGLQITPLNPPSPSQDREKPILWDVCPRSSPFSLKFPGGGNCPAFGSTWENLSPLSATYVRTLALADECRSPALAEQQPPPRARWGVASLFLGRGMMRSFAAGPALVRPPPPFSASPVSSRRAPRAQPEVRWRGHRLPQFLARPLLPPGMDSSVTSLVPDDSAPEPERTLPVRALEVAVMVAMPSPANSTHRRTLEKVQEEDGEIEESLVTSEGELGDFALGFARVPWAKELDGVGSVEGKSVPV